MDDALLLTRARKGDEGAFSELFQRHERHVFRYAAYMCGPQAGDDIVQDTFLAVLRQSGRQDSVQGSVGGYLLGIARHLVMKRLAAQGLEPRAFRPGEEDEEPRAFGVGPRVFRPGGLDDLSPLDAMTRAETVTTVKAAVESLPAVYREVVVLCEFQEMDYDTAAAVIECPIGTVRSRLHRARRLLATKLAALMNPQGSTR